MTAESDTERGRYGGLILAGGRSRRFGSDKADHIVRGVRMVDSVYRAVAAVIRDVRVGLADAESHHPLAGVEAVFDDPPGVGPLGSLRAGLIALPAEWLLVAACDMPLLSDASVRRLLEAVPRDPARSDSRERPPVAVVARDPEGRLHPLFAVYHRRTRKAIERNLAGNRRSMHALLAELDVSAVDFGPRELANVNRPEDLDSLA